MTPQDPEKIENREKICRQVASLFALTTSGVAGEASAAKNKVKALVKAHTLTFVDVSPFGNEIALKVMRSFWSLPADAPPSSPVGSQRTTGEQRTTAEGPTAQEIADMIERMRRAAGFGRPQANSYGNPFWQSPDEAPDPWEANRRSETYRTPRSGAASAEGASVFVFWQGQRMRVQDLSEYALQTLIQNYDTFVQRQAQARRDAHDAIDAEQYDKAIGLLRSLGHKTSVSPEVYQVLLAERQKRALRPEFRPRSSGPF